MNKHFVFFSAFSLASCASTTAVKLNPAAESVQIIKSEPDPVKCRFIKDVYGQAKSKDVAEGQLNARNDLKNKAAALGANLVTIDTNAAANAMDWTGRNQFALNGRAFSCK